ncbi:hypothetical protein FHS29_004816 [Saccharothrix tamanrassetensis]|uniref:Uncharacterized protein n=1 Tax=Saccharothrix tamanrassetensis TaxID=1051531 RepID=A0A841CPZ5_9PSEU|nr:hypothetical protein [Saccharothrix tamanrassetensis]MBB5958208.1 hypothetical protein [Saccharothrix tamanrassetensis]
MRNTQGRTGLRARLWAVGAVGAAITALVPGIATASPAARADLACGELEANGGTVFGYDCDTERWGELASFTLSGPGGEVYRCHEGWAEGSLWVRGDECRRGR